MPKARLTVRPLDIRPDASSEEMAHARGLHEGMLRKVNRLKQEIEKRHALGIALKKKIGLRERRIHELETLLAEALPNLDSYVIMAADEPGSLWSRIHTALTSKRD